MSVTTRIGCFALGFALAAPVGVSLWPSGARAQQAPVTSVTGLPQRQAPLSQRPPSRPLPPADDEEMQPQPAPQPPGEDDPNGDGTQPAEGDPNAERTAPTPARNGRRVPVDGDPSFPGEPVQPQDGIILDGQPTMTPSDNEDPSQIDQRSRADVAPFETPAAGYDALAFQIELDPILDRRPVYLARFEPYAPIGYRRGSWVIFPDVEIGATTTSNVFRNPNAKGDLFFDVRPTIRAVTDWRQHALEFKATGFLSEYNGFSTENDRAYAFEMRGRLDLAKRTSIELLASRALDQELRSSRQAPEDAMYRSDIETTRVAAAFNHSFNRLSVQLRGSLTDTNVLPVQSVAGAIISNAERDNTQREGAVRVAWMFKPTLSAFSEYAINTRSFYTAPSSDGILRDSSGERMRVGISFGQTGQVLRGEISAGRGSQRPDDTRLGAISGTIVDANLAWKINGLSSLLFTARSDFVDSFGVGVTGSLSRLASVELRHAFQRRLIGSASLAYAVADYKGLTGQDKTLTGDLGVEYHVNSNAILFSRYTHVAFDSSAPGGAAYTVDTVRVGMKLRQ